MLGILSARSLRASVTAMPRIRWLAVALVLFALNLGMSSLGLYRSFAKDCRQWQSTKQDVVYGINFRNERVELDGKLFDHCTFENVTFVYDGLAPSGLKASTILPGKLGFLVRNRPAQALQTLLEAMPAGLPMYIQDDHGNLTPLVPYGR